MNIYEIFLGGEYQFINFITKEFKFYSFSNLSFALMLSSLFIILVLLASYKFNVLPGFFQAFIEECYFLVYDFTTPYCNGYHEKYAKYLTGLFFYVLLLNLLNLMPFLCELTSQIFISLSISSFAILFVFFININEHGWHFYKQFILESPVILKPFLFIMEFFLFFLKIITLALRMSIAIGVGHFLLMIISNLKLHIPGSCIIIFLLSSIIMLVEIAVAFIQAYIFMLFICLSISDMLKKH